MDFAMPTPQHVEWADCEIGAIIHLDIEVFQPDWELIVNGKVQPPPHIDLFNPKELDTDQWIQVAKAAGATYAVLTAKHVTGFTLFPDPDYDYSIASTPWKGGKGDIVADFVASCRKHGVRPGLYYSCEASARLGIHKGSGNLPAYPSPAWDEFTRVVTRHLSIIWSRYGDLFEIWFDGGLLEHGPDYIGLLQRYQPDAICFQGPHQHPSNVRWVGNERGEAPYPCWSTTSLAGHDFNGTEEARELGVGSPDGTTWMPAETDVPIRFMNWFWKPGGEFLLAPPELLLQWYYTSVGRNSNLLLGIVIDDRGRVPDPDVALLREFGEMVRARFASPVAEASGEGTCIDIPFPAPAIVNHAVVMENIATGHRVRGYVVEGRLDDDTWIELCSGSCVGHKHINVFPDRRVKGARLRVTSHAGGQPVIRRVALHCLEPLDIDDE